MKWFDEVMQHALVQEPVPESGKDKAKSKSKADDKSGEDVVRPH